MGEFLIILMITTIGILPIIMLIETFKLFSNVKIIKEQLIKQNQNMEALLNLGIMIKNQNENKKD